MKFLTCPKLYTVYFWGQLLWIPPSPKGRETEACMCCIVSKYVECYKPWPPNMAFFFFVGFFFFSESSWQADSSWSWSRQVLLLQTRSSQVHSFHPALGSPGSADSPSRRGQMSIIVLGSWKANSFPNNSYDSQFREVWGWDRVLLSCENKNSSCARLQTRNKCGNLWYLAKIITLQANGEAQNWHVPCAKVQGLPALKPMCSVIFKYL